MLHFLPFFLLSILSKLYAGVCFSIDRWRELEGGREREWERCCSIVKKCTFKFIDKILFSMNTKSLRCESVRFLVSMQCLLWKDSAIFSVFEHSIWRFSTWIPVLGTCFMLYRATLQSIFASKSNQHSKIFFLSDLFWNVMTRDPRRFVDGIPRCSHLHLILNE